MTKSSRERVKAIISPVTMPGSISGISTLKKARRGVQPRSIAASGRGGIHLLKLWQHLQYYIRQAESHMGNEHGPEAEAGGGAEETAIKYDISIRDMPVMISGFIMGILVTVSITAWR